jgi:hypothetical protein
MVLCDRRCRMYGWSEPLLCIQIHLIQHLEVYLTLLPPLLWCCVMFCYLSQLFLYYSTHSLRGMQRQVRRWKDLLCCYCENITGTLQVFHHAYLGRYFPPLSSGRVGPGLWSSVFNHCFIGLIWGEIYFMNRNIMGLYIFSRVDISNKCVQSYTK